MTFRKLAEYFERLEETSSRLALIDILTELFSEVEASEIPMVSYLIQGRVAPFYEATEIGMAEKSVASSIARAYGVEREEVLKEYGASVLRYFFMSGHYRKPLDFSKSSLESAKNSYERLKNICEGLKEDKRANKNYLKDFEKCMNNDFNSPKALQVLWKLVRDKEAKGKYDAIKMMDEVFGFKLLEKKELKIPKEVKELLKKRGDARKGKNWEDSDRLREKIKKLGFQVLDGKEGQEVKKF